ncbi:MAG: hypothetical protein ACYCW6_24610, partial [Candidatus Xenobia bacterium]
VAGARAVGREYKMVRRLRRNRFGTVSLATASSFPAPVVLLELDSVEGQDLWQAATQEYRDEEGFRVAAWLDEGWIGTLVVEIPPGGLEEEKLLPERLEVFCHVAIDRTMFGG